MKTAGGSSAPQTSGISHQPAEKQQQRTNDGPKVGDVIGDGDDTAPHDRRGHAEPPKGKRGQSTETDIDERDRAEIGRGRVHDLLDDARGRQRAFEAAPTDDRLLPHRGPSGEEEEDHEQREEKLDQQVGRRANQQARHGIGRLDPYRARLLPCDRDLGRGPVDELVEVFVEVEHRFEGGTNLRDLRGICATQSVAGITMDPIAKIASNRKMTMHRPAAGLEGIPRRSNHSSSGTSAIAMTSAAVTGMKNSAPARSANGSETMRPIPASRVSDASRRSRFAVIVSASVRASSEGSSIAG